MKAPHRRDLKSTLGITRSRPCPRGFLPSLHKSSRAPSRWGFGLTVLLEKIAGIALVNKLRAILLFEADSNMFNSFVFVRSAMEMARQHNLIPQEQYAER